MRIDLITDKIIEFHHSAPLPPGVEIDLGFCYVLVLSNQLTIERDYTIRTLYLSAKIETTTNTIRFDPDRTLNPNNMDAIKKELASLGLSKAQIDTTIKVVKSLQSVPGSCALYDQVSEINLELGELKVYKSKVSETIAMISGAGDSAVKKPTKVKAEKSPSKKPVLGKGLTKVLEDENKNDPNDDLAKSVSKNAPPALDL